MSTHCLSDAAVGRTCSTRFAAVDAMREEIQNAADAELPPPLLAALHRELADMLEAQEGNKA